MWLVSGSGTSLSSMAPRAVERGDLDRAHGRRDDARSSRFVPKIQIGPRNPTDLRRSQRRTYRHEPSRAHREPGRSGPSPRRGARRRRLPVERLGEHGRRDHLRRRLPAVRLRGDDRLPPACSRTAPSRRTSRSSTCSRCSAPTRCRARCSTGSPTTASTTPTPTGGRPALPAHRRRPRPARPLARAHRLAVRDPGPGGLEELRPRPLRGQGHAPAGEVRSRSWRSGRSRSRPSPASPLHGWTAEGALRGLVWGGLVRVFLLHHVTWSINSICHFYGRRRFAVEDQLDQRRLAVRALARRELAPQPPRLPALGQARPALVGDRPLRARHRGDGEARPGLERRAHHPRAPAAASAPDRHVASCSAPSRQVLVGEPGSMARSWPSSPGCAGPRSACAVTSANVIGAAIVVTLLVVVLPVPDEAARLRRTGSTLGGTGAYVLAALIVSGRCAACASRGRSSSPSSPSRTTDEDERTAVLRLPVALHAACRRVLWAGGALVFGGIGRHGVGCCSASRSASRSRSAASRPPAIAYLRIQRLLRGAVARRAGRRAAAAPRGRRASASRLVLVVGADDGGAGARAR